MRFSTKRLTYFGIILVLGLGFLRAANFRFQEKERAIRAAFSEQIKKSGLTRDALKAKYPTPEIRMAPMACIAPGAAGEVVIKGKFAPDTKFIFENDNVETVKENLMPAEYRAIVKVAPGIGPQSAAVQVISPSLITARQENVIGISGSYEWSMEAANGWRVVARPKSPAKGCGDKSSGDPHEVSFFRKGEVTPFQKRDATLSFSLYESNNYHLRISNVDPQANPGLARYTELMQKMSDPKLSPTQRDQLMKDLQKAGEQMQADMRKATDPNYQKEQQAKKLEFGCEAVWFSAQAGAIKGEMRCSQKVGTRIPLTGTMKPL